MYMYLNSQMIAYFFMWEHVKDYFTVKMSKITFNQHTNNKYTMVLFLIYIV